MEIGLVSMGPLAPAVCWQRPSGFLKLLSLLIPFKMCFLFCMIDILPGHHSVKWTFFYGFFFCLFMTQAAQDYYRVSIVCGGNDPKYNTPFLKEMYHPKKKKKFCHHKWLNYFLFPHETHIEIFYTFTYSNLVQHIFASLKVCSMNKM